MSPLFVIVVGVDGRCVVLSACSLPGQRGRNTFGNRFVTDYAAWGSRKEDARLESAYSGWTSLARWPLLSRARARANFRGPRVRRTVDVTERECTASPCSCPLKETNERRRCSGSRREPGLAWAASRFNGKLLACSLDPLREPRSLHSAAGFGGGKSFAVSLLVWQRRGKGSKWHLGTNWVFTVTFARLAKMK